MKNTKINTYEDLVKEQEQLEALLHAQKELVVYDFKLLKDEFKPATNALNLLGKVTTKERSNVFLNEASGKLIDLVLKKVILGRAGWATKFLVPMLMKNYTSHFLAGNTDKLKGKLFSWFNHKSNGNGKAAPEVHTQGN
ncbi:MAG TPA: hypothetical protein VGO58_17815 [Chitinophagaceae bacterium]|jgi:hypothetical protein|nr:hypothetical protein [Chitinophagaceae bacterium]